MPIKYVWDFNRALEQGQYAFPGGYECCFFCSDGEALSFPAAQENASLIRDAIITNDRHSGWHVVAFEIVDTEEDLICAHSGVVITSMNSPD
jgi:hypothetical protein